MCLGSGVQVLLNPKMDFVSLLGSGAIVLPTVRGPGSPNPTGLFDVFFGQGPFFGFRGSENPEP